MSDKTAIDIMDEMQDEDRVTLDRLMDRNPRTRPISRTELLDLIDGERRKRAAFIQKGQK